MALLEVNGIKKIFEGKKGAVAAVDGVSFQADAGEIFGLLGPNGAGKTTTIRIIATVLDSTAGTARVAGFDILEHAPEVRTNIGLLTTDIGLYDRFTGRENLRYFGELYGILPAVLEPRINELVGSLMMASFIDRRAGKYSTGMKQKVAIARAVIHDPKVIIFDEPTSGLDVLAAQAVVQFMQHAREQGKCVILSTHIMHDAERLCDRVAIIHQGKLIKLGTVHSIREETGTHSLEDAFLKIIGPQAAAPTHQESQGTQAPRAFSKSGIRIAGKLFAWWRVVLIFAVLIGTVAYEVMRK
ncbi:MAG: ATP-binding cassette domain-containing protein [Patescibacteria group bacterium]|nr:ATP-binding cassette domain-containing protein [Patescibacteria group bacterium]MDD5715259.1 ATP-binding cassette domain-containing protein [Patescibacteria group bacterium]